MKCVYCDTNNTYRDRRDGRCKKCGKPFAFEPKERDKALALTDKRFQSAIEAVSGHGRLFFTARQLYYQIIRREGRALISYRTFQEALLRRWIGAHGRPEKLLSLDPGRGSGGAHSAEPDVQQYSFDRLLVVDRAETAHMLVANNLHFETSTPIIAADGYPRDVFATVMTMVRRNPALRVFVLHDADPDGCRLSLALRERPEWFPAPSVSVLDLGLRPMQIAAMQSFIEQKDAPPHEVPSELMRVLSPGERRWLAAGNRGELAYFPPDRTMKTVYRMVQSAGGQEVAAKRWGAIDLRGFCQTALPGARFAGFSGGAGIAMGRPTRGAGEGSLPGGTTEPRAARVLYSDRLRPDGSVERRYATGVTERRAVKGPGQIEWTDDRGGSGTDFNLGDGNVVRQTATGESLAGRQLGFGITCWNDGARITVNETPLPEREPRVPPPSLIGRCISGLGLGGFFGEGSIRAGKRRIRPGSPEFPLYAEYAEIRRWMEGRRAAGAQFVQPDPYFWVYPEPYPVDVPRTTSGDGGTGGNGGGGDAGGGAWGSAPGDAGAGEIGGWGGDSGAWTGDGGWGGDSGGWGGDDGDGFG